MIETLIRALMISLALTLVLEIGFFLLIRTITKTHDRKDLLLVVLVNILTNPAVVFIYFIAVRYTGINYVIIIIVLEILAVLVEGYLYKRHGKRFTRPYVFALAANVFSFGVGLVLQFTM